MDSRMIMVDRVSVRVGESRDQHVAPICLYVQCTRVQYMQHHGFAVDGRMRTLNLSSSQSEATNPQEAQ